MSTTLHFRVYGVPGAQGSKSHVGGGRMVESSKKVRPWRQDVVEAARAAIAAVDAFDPFETYVDAVEVHLVFVFSRPKHHYGTGRNAAVLKPSAPYWVTSHSAGDVDKLCRSTFDAFTTAGIWRDDSLAVRLHADTVYGDLPGVRVRLAPAPEMAIV